jgi:hypothetical protein
VTAISEYIDRLQVEVVRRQAYLNVPSAHTRQCLGDPFASICEQREMSDAIGSRSVESYLVEERIIGGETVWVAIRARGTEWSWLTPAEAAHLGQQWVEKYCSGYEG